MAARWAVGLLHFALGTVGIFPGAEAAVKKLWLGLWHVSDMCARARSMNASGRLKHVDLSEGGHHLHLTEPKPVAAAVLEALASVPRWEPPPDPEVPVRAAAVGAAKKAK